MRSEGMHVRAPRRRAMALMIAISVLGILTILVMALVASQETVRRTAAGSQARVKARQLIRFALDSATTQGAKHFSTIQGERHSRTEGEVTLFGRATKPEDKIYEGPFLKHRPGDGLVTVSARVALGTRRLIVIHTYLVNASAQGARRLRLQEEITMEEITTVDRETEAAPAEKGAP